MLNRYLLVLAVTLCLANVIVTAMGIGSIDSYLLASVVAYFLTTTIFTLMPSKTQGVMKKTSIAAFSLFVLVLVIVTLNYFL